MAFDWPGENVNYFIGVNPNGHGYYFDSGLADEDGRVTGDRTMTCE